LSLFLAVLLPASALAAPKAKPKPAAKPAKTAVAAAGPKKPGAKPAAKPPASAPALTPEQQEAAKQTAYAELGAGDAAYTAQPPDYATALAHYQNAFKAFPSPKIDQRIGVTEYQLGKHVEALASLQAFMKQVPVDPSDPSSQSDHDDAQQKIAELQKMLGVINVTSKPTGAAVTIDGQSQGNAPVSETVEPGAHKVHVELTGYLAQDLPAMVKAGGTLPLAVSLQAVPKPKPAPPNPKPTPPPPAVASSGHGVLIGGIVTGAMAVGWLAFGALALSEHGTYTDTSQTPAARRDAQSSGKNDALYSDLFLAGTAVSGIITYYVWHKQHSEAAAGTTHAELSPTFLPGGGGFALSGQF
jgi:hypothetical protein